MSARSAATLKWESLSCNLALARGQLDQGPLDWCHRDAPMPGCCSDALYRLKQASRAGSASLGLDAAMHEVLTRIGWNPACRHARHWRTC